MTRPLIAVDARNVAAVSAALRSALDGAGPAVIPVAQKADVASLPHDVASTIAVVVETSGSSGRPKRVGLSAHALMASAAASASALGTPDAPGVAQWLLAVPAHYIAGINVLVRSIAAGTEPVVLESGHFDSTDFIAAADRLEGASRFVSVVPAQLARLLSSPNAHAIRTLRRFDRILVGGQSTPRPLLDAAVEHGLAVTRTYGSSETSGGCVYDGRPFDTASIRVIDGQVELSGNMLAEEYVDDPELTQSRFVVDAGTRWYRTGDAGAVDDGVLSISGRLDRVIISGGVKVSLDAIERIVRVLEGAGSAVAAGVPDARWGEVPVVVNSSPLDLDIVRTLVGAQLGAAARPTRILLAEVPALPNGKPDLARVAEFARAATAS